jgi:DoxX-like family
VPLRFFPVLASLELAGAAGILIGLWLEPLGIAAAVGLVAYFIGAVTGHPRVGDTKNLTMPMPPLVLSIAVLVLRLVTA